MGSGEGTWCTGAHHPARERAGPDSLSGGAPIAPPGGKTLVQTDERLQGLGEALATAVSAPPESLLKCEFSGATNPVGSETMVMFCHMIFGFISLGSD